MDEREIPALFDFRQQQRMDTKYNKPAGGMAAVGFYSWKDWQLNFTLTQQMVLQSAQGLNKHICHIEYDR